jgi:hypothetical protein
VEQLRKRCAASRISRDISGDYQGGESQPGGSGGLPQR